MNAVRTVAATIALSAALAGCTGSPDAGPPTPAVTGASASAEATPPGTAPPGTPEPAHPAAGLPAHSGSGQRIVWSKGANRVWLVTADQAVVRTFRVSDNDRKTPLGTYRIHRRNPEATSITGAKLAYFLGFYRRPGHTDWIGLHAVPLRGKKYDRKFTALGRDSQPPTPGCIYTTVKDARATWRFADGDTKVVVVS